MERVESVPFSAVMEILACPELREAALSPASPSGLSRRGRGCDISSLIALTEEGPPPYRAWAFQALRTVVESPTGRRHVDALAEGDVPARQAAISRLLACSGGHGSQLRGAEAGMRHPDRWVRDSILELLIHGAYGGRERSARDEPYDRQIMRRQVRALEVALQDPERTTREKAMEGLKKLVSFSRIVAPVLLRALRNPDPEVRYTTVELLSDVEQPPSAFAGELTRLLTDSDASVRTASIYALSKYSPDHEVSRNAIQPLLAVLRTPGSHQRLCAAVRLHEIGYHHPDVLSTLVDLLDDLEWNLNAVRVLGDIGEDAGRNPGWWCPGCFRCGKPSSRETAVPSFMPSGALPRRIRTCCRR